MCLTIKEELVKEYLEEFVSSPNKFTTEDQGEYSLRTRFTLFIAWQLKRVGTLHSNLQELHGELKNKDKFKLLTEEDRNLVVHEIISSLIDLFSTSNLDYLFELMGNPFELGKESYTLFNKYNIHSKSSIPKIMVKTVQDNKISLDYLTLSGIYISEKDIEIEDGFNLVASGF